ncbi:MAG TPA: long-chain fatty acid--CoA ligase [Saprospiraceae bacterium]|nr:long-chain fatty acid--CoA ligase [Saprospiraceae bacterium]
MDFLRLFDILPYQQMRFPNSGAIRLREGDGWRSFSTAACIEEINKVSAGLLHLGIQQGDKVAIMAHTGSPYWNFFDLGAQQIGAVVVPLHATLGIDELLYILQDAQVRCCFVADIDLCEKTHQAKSQLTDLQYIITLSPVIGARYWPDFAVEPDDAIRKEIAQRRQQVHTEDLATIIYTSGTTGEPKGVMLSHRNLVSNIKSIIALIPVAYDKRVFSFLPLSHVFERMVTYTYLATGASLHYPASRDTTMQDLRAARPHYFTAVPRILERVYDAIMAEVRKRPLFVRRIVKWAIAFGEHYNETRRLPLPDYWLKRFLADVIVFRQWRRQLGGAVEGIAVGAAALQPRLGRLFSAAGIPIREGYGLTETSPVVAFNRFEPGGVRFCTVGIPIPGVEVRIEQPNEYGEGEILVRGPNVMMGYYGKPEATQAVLDAEGWLHTGDVGKMIYRRFLQITDRKKDIFKTSSGMYVSPQYLENYLRTSSYIEQCMIIGFKRPYVAALLLPNFLMLEQWCREHNVHWTSPPYMVLNNRVLKMMEQEIAHLNESLAHHQRVRRFVLLHQPWSEHTGELTPTLKARRQVLLEKYSKEIESLFD